MRTNFLSLPMFLLLALLPGWSMAEATWVELGMLQFPSLRATGKLSLNLDSLRRRTQHYEIWQRIVFDVGQNDELPGEAIADRMTLWALSCRRGEMAKVTEGVAGAFEPRAETLRFFIPVPMSFGATVIETACAEVRRRVAEKRSLQAADKLNDYSVAPANLDNPPSMADDDFDEGED